MQQGGEIRPYDPHHFHHHLIHRKEAHYQGDRVPEETSFYAEIAEALASAGDIVLVGHGVGKSSAVDALLTHLKAHRPQLAQRVKGVEVLDLSALSEAEIEAVVKRKLSAASIRPRPAELDDQPSRCGQPAVNPNCPRYHCWNVTTRRSCSE